MTLLKPEQRQSIVEEICTRFHKDGIARLNTVGYFEKYTPQVHFRISEPNDEDFIYITDLFGNVNKFSNLTLISSFLLKSTVNPNIFLAISSSKHRLQMRY